MILLRCLICKENVPIDRRIKSSSITSYQMYVILNENFSHIMSSCSKLFTYVSTLVVVLTLSNPQNYSQLFE